MSLWLVLHSQRRKKAGLVIVVIVSVIVGSGRHHPSPSRANRQGQR